MGWLKDLEIRWKYRGQAAIQRDEGQIKNSSEKKFFFEGAYKDLEVVSRGSDMLVDSASEIDINITGTLPFPPKHGNARQRQKKLFTLLNFRPNDYEDVNAYRRQLYMDLLLTGNCYQYYDGTNLFQLPSKLMEVVTDNVNKVKFYKFDSDIKYSTEEIIHTRDNSATSIYVGNTRLRSAVRSVEILRKMLNFQDLFFKNGAIPGLILTTPNILGSRIKQKMLVDWQNAYSPTSGAKKPIILDGDLKLNPISQITFKDLDFENSVASHELKILKAIGVPPILLDSGNNANLRPNIQLFYEFTVLPLTAKLISSYEKFFAYDMEPDVVKVRSLRPELREAGQYFSGLVNTGIMTINEAREELRLERSTEEHADELRIPQNIAGSATDPTSGGRPPGEEDDEEESEDENP
jgi:HK97 family phage portal protein